MNCEQFEEMLDKCFDEPDKVSLSDEMKAHMAECASCRDLYTLKRTLPLINDADEEMPEDASGILENVIRQNNIIYIGGDPERKSANRTPVWIRWASAAAAVLVLAAGAAVLMRNGIRSPGTVEKPTSVSSDTATEAGASGRFRADAVQEETNKSRSFAENTVPENKMPAATGKPSAASAPVPAGMYLSAEMPAAKPDSFAGESAAVTSDAADYMSAAEISMAASEEVSWDMDTLEECAEEHAPAEVFTGGAESEAAILPDLTRNTNDTDGDLDRVRELAKACGGKIKSTKITSVTSDDSWTAVITLRIPESNLDTFLSGMTDKGWNVTRDENTPFTDATEDREGISFIVLTLVLREIQ